MPRPSSALTQVKCDSRYISRCATALADASYGRDYSRDEWVILYNRAVQVLTEQRAEMIAGESHRSILHDLTLAGIVAFIVFVAVKLLGGAR